MHRYLFDSGVVIEYYKLIDIVGRPEQQKNYYLSYATGKVISSTKVKNSENLFKLPVWPETQQVIALEAFIDLMLAHETPELTKKIQQFLKKGQSIVEIAKLLDDDEGWIHAWDQDKSKAVGEFVDHWLETLPVEIRTELDLDDDCPICLAMKAAENLERDLTEEELLAAFSVTTGRKKH